MGREGTVAYGGFGLLNNSIIGNFLFRRPADNPVPSRAEPLGATNVCGQPVQLADPVPHLEIRGSLARLELAILLRLHVETPRGLTDRESAPPAVSS